MSEKKRNKKKKYKPPLLEELSVQEGGNVATICSHWRGVWGSCDCHCEQGTDSPIN